MNIKMEKKNSKVTGLMDLPNETLIYIFEFLTFEEVAKFRILSKRVDEICQKILNSGFQRAAQVHAATYKRIKALLPRRESERRNHALARHADILTSVETRISMLSMTYTKYMDLNLCCFIPGRVLDEIFRILRLTTRTSIPLRPLEILQEFRDISSMAIEHFDEKIASEFKKTIERNAVLKLHGGAGSSGCAHRRSLSAPENLTGIIIGEPEPGELLLVRKCVTPHIIKHTCIQATDNAAQPLPQKSCRSQRNSVIRCLHHRIQTLQRKGVQQNKRLAFFARKVNSLTSQTSAMKRRLDELDSKNQELIGTIRQYSLEEAQGTEAPPRTATNEEEKRQGEPKPHGTEGLLDGGDQNSICEVKSPRKPIKRSLDEVGHTSNDDSGMHKSKMMKKGRI